MTNQTSYYIDYIEEVLKLKINTDIKIILKKTLEDDQGNKHNVFIGLAPYKKGLVIGDEASITNGQMVSFCVEMPPGSSRWHTIEKKGGYSPGFHLFIKNINNEFFYELGSGLQPDHNAAPNLFLSRLDLKYLGKRLENEVEMHEPCV